VSTEAQELRSRIRDLVASGDLPSEQPVIHRAGEVSRLPCLICGEAEPTVAYFWTGCRVVHLHASCDALWMQKRGGSVR
jgi:hypothetical protein